MNAAKHTADLKKVVVITGSIGSGKTTVSSMLCELGAVSVSADQLAREVVESGSPALDKIANEFGAEYVNAEEGLDRAKLATLVFSDPAALERLEKILHPAIEALAERRIAEAQAANAALVLYDCPLYFEAGLEQKGFAAVVVVTADPSDAFARVHSRDSISKEAFEYRLQAQMKEEEKRSKADFIIENTGTLEALRANVKALAPQLFAIAQK